MIDSSLLIIAAFLSSSLTAVLGLGSGMLLISVMSVFLPPVAVISGSYAGTKLRQKVPEELFRKGFKLLITLLAIRMTLKPFL